MKTRRIPITFNGFLIAAAIGLFVFKGSVSAQGMMGQSATPATTADVTREASDEAAGKALYDKLQAKETSCQNLTDAEFEVLGDYFMGTHLGNTQSHTTMDAMMTQMMGASGEKQMHVFLGKRASDCDSDVKAPTGASQFLPMMGMMNGTQDDGSRRGGAFPMMGGFYGNMMGGNFGLWSVFGVATWIALFTFLVLGILYFLKEIGSTKKK